MTVVIEHVRHRIERVDENDARVSWTFCGRRVAKGGQKRDWDHHLPERALCARCYA